MCINIEVCWKYNKWS